jgi:hypothetical protein
MNGIKVTSRLADTLTYTDATSRHEVTIGRIEDYYFGWYFVDREENSYMGKMADGKSLETVIATLEQFAREDFGLRYDRAEEVIDLLEKVLAVYPRD